MPGMRFSYWPSVARTWEEIRDIAAHCEQTGWDGLYYADHFMPNGPGPEPLDGPTLECWSVLSALAVAVPRVRLAPLVTSITYRHPALLANIAAATDQISGGRLTLGIGAGWQENEHASYGIELGTVGERLDRFEEATQILRSMLDQPRTTFAGKYYQLDDAPNQPGPVQNRVPLLIGGAGERRMLGIVARYADEWNAWTTPELLTHKLSVLRGHCEAADRDPGTIHVSTQAVTYLSTDEEWLKDKRDPQPRRPLIAGTPAEVTSIVARYQEAGADELIIPDFSFSSVEQVKDTCDLFMQEVAASFR